MKKTQIFIFDLDDTVIDSSHRAKLAVEDGKVVLDLQAWKRDSTHKNIMKDSLLPLATYMRECIQAEHTYVWVCTARNMQSADHEFLAKHGLTPNLVLSRQLDDDTADHILKKKMIGKLLNLKPFKDCETIFFDDKPKNLQALENLIDFNLNATAINSIGAIPIEWATS
tara:strand:+ start:102 stop:608 length:507 start_codon:yes stop_codon:yes gene_type:complete